MTKDELRALAALGVREKIATIERELERLYAEFPDVFAGDTVPILLRAEVRAKGNGWSPEHARAVSKAAASARASWTPARRAQAARRMKAQHRAQTGRGKLKPKNWKAKWYARLEKHGPESVGASAKALGTQSANLLTGARAWIASGTIARQGKGLYAAGPRPA